MSAGFRLGRLNFAAVDKQQTPLRAGRATPLQPDQTIDGANEQQPVNHFRCIGYAIRTIFRVLPALGRSSDHLNPPPGLGIKHFVVAGVVCAALLVCSIVGAVSLILSLVTRH